MRVCQIQKSNEQNTLIISAVHWLKLKSKNKSHMILFIRTNKNEKKQDSSFQVLQNSSSGGIFFLKHKDKIASCLGGKSPLL